MCGFVGFLLVTRSSEINLNLPEIILCAYNIYQKHFKKI